MDTIESKLAQLEAKLAAAHVPQALWPTCSDLEKARKRKANAQAQRIEREERRQQQIHEAIERETHTERERKNWFLEFILLMLLLSNERHKSPRASLQSAVLALAASRWARVASDQIQTSAVCVAAVQFGSLDAIRDELSNGIADGIPLARAQTLIEREREQQQQQEKQRQLEQELTEQQEQEEQQPTNLFDPGF